MTRYRQPTFGWVISLSPWRNAARGWTGPWLLMFGWRALVLSRPQQAGWQPVQTVRPGDACWADRLFLAWQDGLGQHAVLDALWPVLAEADCSKRLRVPLRT
jgi:hypothetical protein